MKLSKAKYKLLHPGAGNPEHRYRQDLRVLVVLKQSMGLQCVLTAQKTVCILGCMKRSVATRLKKVILPSTPPS